jgi:uncharacterized membrane protein YfcA
MSQKPGSVTIQMEPKRKLSLLILAVSVPNVCAVFGLAIGHYRPPEWLIRLWLGCGLIGVVCVFVYMFRHPELRPSPEERAGRSAQIDPRTARIWIFLIAGIASALIILTQSDPLSHAWGRSVTPNRALISILRAVAWFGLLVGLAGLIRLGQVWYRKRKARLANNHSMFPSSGTRARCQNCPRPTVWVILYSS